MYEVYFIRLIGLDGWYGREISDLLSPSLTHLTYTLAGLPSGFGIFLYILNSILTYFLPLLYLYLISNQVWPIIGNAHFGNGSNLD